MGEYVETCVAAYSAAMRGAWLQHQFAGQKVRYPTYYIEEYCVRQQPQSRCCYHYFFDTEGFKSTELEDMD